MDYELENFKNKSSLKDDEEQPNNQGVDIFMLKKLIKMNITEANLELERKMKDEFEAKIKSIN